MGTISKNNINITWDKDNDWGKFSELIIDSISTTLVYEKYMCVQHDVVTFNVYFVDNNQIKELNNQYLENNYETDVLSFNFYDGWKDGKIVEKKGLFPGEENLNELGELYLSIPKIIQQSKENNVTFLKELSTMAVHGTLHLLGYNHEVLNEEKIMFSKTSKILENISLKE